VRHLIDELSDLRHNLLLLDSATHLTLDCPQPQNLSGSAALIEGIQLLAGVTPVDDWLPLLSAGVAPASTGLTSPCDEMLFSSWSRLTSAPARMSNKAQSFLCADAAEFGGLPAPRIVLTFQVDVPPRDNRAALLRLLDGILSALCLMLVLVLAALSRQPNALAFVLVILAVCLRYGRRSEPDGHAFLPMRRYQTSLGSCPHG
jgi:hypothetical protein